MKVYDTGCGIPPDRLPAHLRGLRHDQATRARPWVWRSRKRSPSSSAARSASPAKSAGARRSSWSSRVPRHRDCAGRGMRNVRRATCDVRCEVLCARCYVRGPCLRRAVKSVVWGGHVPKAGEDIDDRSERAGAIRCGTSNSAQGAGRGATAARCCSADRTGSSSMTTRCRAWSRGSRSWRRRRFTAGCWQPRAKTRNTRTVTDYTDTEYTDSADP